MKKRIYVDSGVLITALEDIGGGRAASALKAISLEDVEYIFGPMVELEVLPKPLRYQPTQAAFFRGWFARARCVWYDQEIHELAMQHVSDHSISPMDATHVATAIVAGADELITSERNTKPMFNQSRVRVRSVIG